jgi:hypothetical protein
MTSLQANNFAQDVLWLHWSVASDRRITTHNKSEPTSVSFFYFHYAMCNKIALTAEEDNVSPLKIAWLDRFNRDHITVANGGMHAGSRGPKTHSKAKAQQLTTQVSKSRR